MSKLTPLAFAKLLIDDSKVVVVRAGNVPTPKKPETKNDK